jgi:hypothetical protein
LVVLVPTAAQASPSFYATPIFGLGKADGGTLLVADAGKGIVNADTGALVVALPGVTDFASRGHGKLWAITSAGGGPGAFLYSVDGGVATQIADLYAFEAANNPHPAAVESNPFDVLALGDGRALVADAAGNDLLRVDLHGNIELVAVFPDELVSTSNIKHLAGCPGSHADFCDLPAQLPAQAVPASVAIGPDGAYYVGELKGFPAPTGASNVWRVDSHAKGAQCGSSPSCTVVLHGLTSILDVIFKGSTLFVAQFDDASWAAIEIFEGEGALGGSVHACNLSTRSCREVVDKVPMLTAIAFRGGHLWGNTWSLVPGRADALPIA